MFKLKAHAQLFSVFVLSIFTNRNKGSQTGNISSTWSWLNAVVRCECENSAIDVIINFL